MKVTDKITVTQEDNMELMSRYPDNYFDLAIVDPPYGIGADKAQNAGGDKWGYKEYKDTDWDSGIPSAEYFKELFRVSKNQIVWGGNYMTDFLPPSMCWMIWNKMQRGFSLADGEMAWTSFNKAMRIYDLSRGAAIQENNKGLDKFHPTAKPISLYHWCLEKLAKEGDKILDTHLGSGSIALACHDYGFELTACELDKDYFDASIKRINNHVSQQRLF